MVMWEIIMFFLLKNYTGLHQFLYINEILGGCGGQTVRSVFFWHGL